MSDLATTTTTAAAGTTPAPLPNPVFDNTNIKKMAERFKTEYVPPTTKDIPKDPLKMSEVTGATAPAVAQPKEEGKEVKETTPLDGEKKEPSTNEEVKLDPSVSLSPKARDHFKRLEQSRDEFKKQLEEIRKSAEEKDKTLKERETELARFKGLPVEPEAIEKALKTSEELTKTNEELTKLIETINLERSPRFQTWWKTETEKHVKLAQRHVPSEKKEELGKLLMEAPSAERDAALDAILEPLGATAKRLVTGAIEQLEAVKIQREEALTRGSEEYRKLQEVEKEEALKREKAITVRKETLTKAALERAKRFDAFVKTDDETHNASIPEREAFVAALVRGEVDEDTALSVAAASVDWLHQTKTVIPSLKEEIKKRDELIKQLQGAGARISDGNAGGSAKPSGPPGSDFTSKVLGLMRG